MYDWSCGLPGAGHSGLRGYENYVCVMPGCNFSAPKAAAASSALNFTSGLQNTRVGVFAIPDMNGRQTCSNRELPISISSYKCPRRGGSARGLLSSFVTELSDTSVPRSRVFQQSADTDESTRRRGYTALGILIFCCSAWRPPVPAGIIGSGSIPCLL